MILMLPPGGETLALRIFNLLHYGHNAQVNALVPACCWRWRWRRCCCWHRPWARSLGRQRRLQPGDRAAQERPEPLAWPV